MRAPYQENGAWKTAFYDGAHQLLNTVTLALPVAPGPDDIVIFLEGSTDFFDNDPGVEMVLRIDRFSGFDDFLIMDDDGTLLFSNQAARPRLYQLSNGDHKVAIVDTIRSLPSFAVEHVFPASFGGTQLGHLEQFGSKYYQLSTTGLVLFNPDYTVFRTFSVSVPVNASGATPVELLGQYNLNGNDAIEWKMVTKTGSNLHESRIFSDTTQLSYHSINVSVLNLENYTLSATAGSGLSSPKSVLRNFSNGFMSVANALNGVVEFEGAQRWRFGDSFGDGIKYYQSGPPSGTDSISVLNTDYTLWTRLKWDPNNTRVLGAYAGIFDTDPATKEILVERDDLANRRAFLFSEGDTPFFSFPLLNQCRNIALSRVVNAPNKLIMSGINKTNVFALPSNGPVSGLARPPQMPSLSVTVQPNPFVGSPMVDLSGITTPTATLLVMDNMGRVAVDGHQVTAGGLHAVEGLERVPAGMYWLRITDETGHYGWTKIIKQ